MPVPPISLLLLLLFWGSVFFAVFQLVPSGEKQEARERLGVAGVNTDQSAIIDSLRPLLVMMAPLFVWIKAERYREWIERRFINAGMAGALRSTEFFAYKFLMAIVFWCLFVGLFLKFLIGWEEPFYIDLIVVALGSYFPDLWLNGQVKDRQHKIRRALPYIMDLLTLSVEAGLDFVAGIGKVCEKARSGPLVDELAYFLGEMQLGASRQQALRNLSYRIDMPEVRSFSALLIQADILGASVGPVLRAMSDLIRTQRFQRAERMGAYASQKILFPLILCIMPAVFVIIFGPVILNFVYGDGVIG